MRMRRHCNICLRSFNKTEHLERHVRSHTKERPFQCSECGKRYGRQHQRHHSEGLTPKQPDASSGGPAANQGSGSAEELAQPQICSALSFTSATNADPVSVSSRSLHSMEPGIIFDAVDHADQSNVASLQTPLSLDDWNIYTDAQFPSWFIDDSFGLDMLSTPIATTMAGLAPFSLENSLSAAPVQAGSRPSLRTSWFTYINRPSGSTHVSGTVTPSHDVPLDDVDENYRQNLDKRLQYRPSIQALPSADFLNLCVKSYFMHFHPVFPIIHAPTFRPSRQNALLFLSICSVGSLFTGSPKAAEQGIQIFEQLNKAILATCDNLLSRQQAELTTVVQAAMIGQTFGILSGHPKHLALIDSFHGTVLAWARRLKAFDMLASAPAPPQNGSGEAMDLAWNEWARREELLRLGLGLHVHDAELTGIFHHEPLLRYNMRRLPVAASTEVFNASTALEWSKLCNGRRQSSLGGQIPTTPESYFIERVPTTSRFTIYGALSGIAASIAEDQKQEMSMTELINTYQATLMTFFSTYLLAQTSARDDPMGLIVLWHSTFMSLFADFDLLERAVGRDGEPSLGDVYAATAWASTLFAKRCVIHASLIHRNLENMPIGHEPAIHVPRVMFAAAISWYCFIRYGNTAGTDDHSTRDVLDFPELKLLSINPAALLFELTGFRHKRQTSVKASGTLCGLTDLLQRIGHWEIARRFSSILGSLLHNETA